jgi:UDP-N-acetylglucosamine 2-epimerase (non-hydrolysing)
MPDRGSKVLVLFGTRPEAIKLAPVIHELRRQRFQTIVVSSSQHKQLLRPFLDGLDIALDFDLRVMRRDQTPNDVCARVIEKLDKVLALKQPDLILVQGDTTTTLAGAMAGFNHLLSEDVPAEKIFVTGNPVVDSLKQMLKDLTVDPAISRLIKATSGKKRILLTTHRRESFGPTLSANLRVLRDFVEKRRDVCLMFPVHPNPNVRHAAREIMGGCERIHLLDPLNYSDFLGLMKAAWLIVSDSGGVQEEAPTLGKPLLVLRENTERPEAIHSGVSKLVGTEPEALRTLLEDNYGADTWTRSVREIANPFGDGRSARRIVKIIGQSIAVKAAAVRSARAAIG